MLSVKFQDGELFQNVYWLSLPNKPIQRLKYNFNGKIIILENYESYNHLVEKVYNVLGGTTGIRSVYLMGRKDNTTKVIILNMINKKITEYVSEIDKEYGKEFIDGQWIGGRPSTGWKKGISA